MKRLHFSLALLALSTLVITAHAEDNVRDFQIGDAAPDFALPGIDGKTHRLADYNNAKILMIFFTSNHCPTSHGADKVLEHLGTVYTP